MKTEDIAKQYNIDKTDFERYLILKSKNYKTGVMGGFIRR